MVNFSSHPRAFISTGVGMAALYRLGRFDVGGWGGAGELKHRGKATAVTKPVPSILVAADHAQGEVTSQPLHRH